MPFYQPITIPSPRLDLTQYALKNTQRFTDGITTAGGNVPAFLRSNGRFLYLQNINGGAGGVDSVLHSLDNGVTWASLFNTGGTGNISDANDLAWDSSGANPGCNILFGVQANVGAGGIFRYRSFTGVATRVLNTGAAASIRALAAGDKATYGLASATAASYSASNMTMLAVGTNRALYRSTDSGATWAAVSLGAGAEVLNQVVSNNAGYWLVSNGTTIWYSSLDGASGWSTVAPNPCPTTLRYGGGYFFGTLTTGGFSYVLRSLTGISWEIMLTVANTSDTIYDVQYDYKGCWVAVGTNFYISDDDGVSWETVRPNNATFLTAGSGYSVGGYSMRSIAWDNPSPSLLPSFAPNRWLIVGRNGSATNNPPLLGAQAQIDTEA